MKQAADLLNQNSKYVSGAGYVISTIKANESITVAYNEGISDCVSLLELTDISCVTHRELLIEKLQKLKK